MSSIEIFMRPRDPMLFAEAEGWIKITIILYLNC
jgi:hypothetical protein